MAQYQDANQYSKEAWEEKLKKTKIQQLIEWF